MATTIQFVSHVPAIDGVTPTVRLDLNSQSLGLMVDVDGIDLTPPPLQRSMASTLMVDGELVVASAHGNRLIEIPLRPLGGTAENVAVTMQALARELARPTNVLKVQLDGMTDPVYFKTYRAPDYDLVLRRFLLNLGTMTTLKLPAEPYALGAVETALSNITVNTNPSAGTNPCLMDVTGIKGDWLTPALIRMPTSTVVLGDNAMSALSTRRRGTVSATPFLRELDSGTSLTLGTDTTHPGNDVLYSGAGSNYARTTFATNAAMVTRLSGNIASGSASTDLRGMYRVFLRCAKSVAGDDIQVRLQWGPTATLVTNATTPAGGTTARHLIDLGLIQIPQGADPIFDGPSGRELSVENMAFILQAQRVSGSGNLQMDCLLLMPADSDFGLAKWMTGASGSDLFIDSGSGNIHFRNGTASVVSSIAPEISGGWPMLQPGQTTRIFFLDSIGISWSHAFRTIAGVYVYYWPRYLVVRPAGA
ncbi:MAG TPA: hypothetical protein VIQ30_26930 [Pseudonocardia sp.]